MTTEKDMLDALIQHQVYSYRASTKAVNDLNAGFLTASNSFVSKLRDLLDDLTDAEKEALTLGKYTTDNLKEVKALFDDWYQVVATQLPDSFSVSAVALATYEAAYISKLYGEEIALDGENIYKSSIKKPIISGQLFDDIWKNLAESTRNKALYAVREGIQNGLNTAQIVNEIRGTKTNINGKNKYVGGIIEDVVGDGLNKKGSIDAAVRTIRSHISQIAYEDTFKALGFDYVKDIVTLDGRTSSTCQGVAARDLIQPIDNITFKPPYHFNCLLGDSHVLTVGGVSGASKRWFDGEIIIIKTARGRELRCTPNHPILTSSGWIGAGLLNVGSDVVSDIIGNWEGLSVGNHKDAPPLIKDVVNSILSSSQMIAMPVPVSTKDFHNDGVGSKVAIVSSNSFLSDCFNSSIEKHILKHNLISRLPMSGVILNSYSSLSKRFKFNRSPSRRCISFSGKPFNFIWCGFSHSSKLLFRSISKFNAMLGKNTFCCGNANTNSINHSTNTNSRMEAINNILLGGVGFSKFVKNMLFRSISNVGFSNTSRYNVVNHIGGNSNVGSDGFLGRSTDIHISGDLADFWSGCSSMDDFVSSIKNNVCDSGLINGVDFGDVGDRFTNAIGLDYIVSVDRDFFSGHVYNLETDDGYYVANGIITHNCRTVQIGCNKDGKIDGKRPFVADTRSVKNIPKGERKDIIGQVDANVNYPEWFSKQSAVFQKEVLGPTKYDLYKNGGFTFDKFVDPLGKPYTIKELKALDQKTFARLGL